MHPKTTGLLLTCFWLVLTASNAMAGSTHSHTHHVGVTSGAPLHVPLSQAISPFEVKLGNKRLHCELLGHNPLLPCPHHKVPADGKDNCYLANECGGGPFQAPASESAEKSPRFLIATVPVEDQPRISMTVPNRSVLYDSNFFHSLDRPPRAL